MEEVPEFEVGDMIHCIRTTNCYDEGDIYTILSKVSNLENEISYCIKDERSGLIISFVDSSHFVKFKSYEKLPTTSVDKKHNHYFKYCPYEYIDVYRVSRLFEVNDAALDHALKKILCSGERGVKDRVQDIEEAIDTLNRWLELEKEERLVT